MGLAVKKRKRFPTPSPAVGRASPAEGEGGGWLQKNWAPRSIVFSSRFARARVSLNCKRALPCSGRRCVCAKVSLVSAGAPRHGPALPAWRLTPGFFCVAHCLCFWRALGQSSPRSQYCYIAIYLFKSPQREEHPTYCSFGQSKIILFRIDSDQTQNLRASRSVHYKSVHQVSASHVKMGDTWPVVEL